MSTTSETRLQEIPVTQTAGLYVACVKATSPSSYGHSPPVYNIFDETRSPVHLEDMTLIVENPAYYRDEGSGNDSQVFWSVFTSATTEAHWRPKLATDDYCILRNVSTGAEFCSTFYLPSIFMHELGHTFGLYHPATPSGVPLPDDGLMTNPINDIRPSAADRRQVRIYI